VAAGFLLAIVGAVCGIGGGLFAVPLLHYAFRLPLRRSVATSLVLVCTTGFAATVAELLHTDNALLWNIVLPLIVGGLIGAQYGFFVSRRLPEVGLKALFMVALLVVGVRLGWMPVGPTHPTAEAARFAWSSCAVSLALGFGAGIVAPLLGIGGGLVVVPGLLLLLPEVGGLGARAASLAMTVPNAARSLQFYQRERAIEWGAALRFAAGALVGGFVGVELVHLEGVARAGQVALGVILVVTATRFGIDVRRRLLARGDARPSSPPDPSQSGIEGNP